MSAPQDSPAVLPVRAGDKAGEVAAGREGEARKAAASPGRRYRLKGGEGWYAVYVGAERVGWVAVRYNNVGWVAVTPQRTYAWRAPTRREALAGLLGHLGIEP